MNYPKLVGLEGDRFLIAEEDGIFTTPLARQAQPTDEQLRILKTSKSAGWMAALKAEMANQGLVQYITDEKRLAILDVLPLEAHQRILEIGPGYGQMTEAIARKVATVDAIEADIGQAHFCRLRCEQQGLENVRIVAGGADGRLPYADDSFDGVVMNLVFEWCAIRSTEPHEKVQTAYLREIARVLKPNGFLFLSTKNRYSLRLLTGGKDEHVGSRRFGSALPRFLGRLALGGARARGHLHSYRRLRSLIERNGFAISQAFWALPNMRWPEKLIPLERSQVIEARRSGKYAIADSGKLAFLTKLVPASLLKHVTPGLTFIAVKR